MKTLVLILLFSAGVFAQSHSDLLILYGSATPSGGETAARTTDSLKWFYKDSDLDTGVVASSDWVDQINSLALTVTSDPTKTDSGIVFDGDDAFYATPTAFDTLLSIDIVVKIVDTTAQSIYAQMRYDATHVFTIGTNGNLIAPYGYTSGGAVTQSYYSTPAFTGELVLITATFDGDTVKLYINGALQTATGSTGEGAAANSNRLSIGSRDGANRFVPNGTIIREVAFYTKELTSDEITQNWEYVQSEYGIE